MTQQRTIHPGDDPVCGMPVDADVARAGELVDIHRGVGYSFCSEGCLTEFQEDPAWFLDPAYSPTSM